MRNFSLIFLVSTCSVVPSAGQETTVDFQAQIWPILRDRCVQCHGSERQDGHLRLDSLYGFRTGGASGRSLLSGEKELLRRIRLSPDDDEHMPLGGPPLSTPEIDLIQTWIMEGGNAAFPGTSGGLDVWTLTKWLKARTQYTRGFFIAALILSLIVLVQERRRKKLIANGRTSQILRTHYALAFLALFAAGLWHHHKMTAQADQQKITELNERLLTLADPRVQVGGDEFGMVPRRPEHPPRLGGEYYRGNDERNERLFNRGFYRTATFRVFLQDESGSRVNYGSEWSNGPLFLDFELERSPGTAAGHYSDNSMSSIFLSRQHNNAVPIDVPVPLDEVKPKWKWHARYKLAKEPTDTLRGRVFVRCSATVENDIVTGAIHYAISYDIKLKDGKVAEGSEVWMGSLFQTENVVAPPLDKIPVDEWFDFRPIPEVVGENPDDPKLLGLENPDG